MNKNHYLGKTKRSMLDDREQEIKDLREKIDELLSSKDDIEKTAEKILSEIQLLEDEKQRF